MKAYCCLFAHQTQDIIRALFSLNKKNEITQCEILCYSSHSSA